MQTYALVVSKQEASNTKLTVSRDSRREGERERE
jgi:hypothetical protein